MKRDYEKPVTHVLYIEQRDVLTMLSGLSEDEGMALPWEDGIDR